MSTPNKPNEEKEAPKPLVDSLGGELHAGDTVSLTATVLEAEPGKDAKLSIELGNAKTTFSVPAHVVKKELTARIGAAPLLRTPVVEIPNPLGGVIPVAKDSKAAQDHLASLADNGVESLPNSSPAVQRLEDGKLQQPAGAKLLP